MSFRFNFVRLLVDDFPASYRFYRDLFGLKPRFENEHGPYEEFRTGEVTLALFDRKEMNVALGRPEPTRTDTPGGQAVVIFAVEDVDRASRELVAKGAPPVAPPRDRPEWRIRTAHFHDPDGNLVEINAPLPG